MFCPNPYIEADCSASACRTENIPNDGLIRYRILGNKERVLLTSSKAISEVLVTKNYEWQKPSTFRALARVLGVGILLAEGDEHKRQRRILMPAFAFRHVKDLYPLFWSKSKEAVHAMTEQVRADARATSGEEAANPTAVMELGDWVSRATLDIIGVAGMGRDFGAIKDPTNFLSHTYRAVFQPSRQASFLAMLNLFLPPWIVSKLPLKRNDDVNQASAVIRDACRDLVREKRERLARKELTDVDILSVAIESGGFSDDDLINQMMTFLAAGHETTASAMQWAIYLLCLHPEVQTRLRDEIRERLPSMNSHEGITALDIDHMPYLAAVCNEVLRYYSPVPMTQREACVDTTIAGQRIPRGTVAIICPWSVNRSSSLWGEDAGKFDPERWLARDEKDRKRAGLGGAESNYAFLTFMHGPRSCIGMGFAKAEFACLLAAVVGRFSFELKNKEEYDEKNLEYRGQVTVKLAKGLWVHATALDGW